MEKQINLSEAYMAMLIASKELQRNITLQIASIRSISSSSNGSTTNFDFVNFGSSPQEETSLTKVNKDNTIASPNT